MKEYFFPLICHLLYRINTVHHNNFRHDLDHPVHLIQVTYINISFLLNYAILDKKKNNINYITTLFSIKLPFKYDIAFSNVVILIDSKASLVKNP